MGARPSFGTSEAQGTGPGIRTRHFWRPWWDKVRTPCRGGDLLARRSTPTPWAPLAQVPPSVTTGITVPRKRSWFGKRYGRDVGRRYSSPRRQCAAAKRCKALYLSVAVDGKVEDAHPYTLAESAGLAADMQLRALRDEVVRILQALNISRIPTPSGDSATA